MDSLTTEINERNIHQVRNLITRKLSPHPFYGTNKSVLPVINDMDHHPYSRWFRGVYYYPDPIIAEREAGWRQQQNPCYNLIIPPMQIESPQHCFEVPCSTIMPCFPNSKENVDILVNKSCIVQYR